MITAGELIAKLQQVDPTLLVCGEDGETGLHADVSVYEMPAVVDRTSSSLDPWVDTPTRGPRGTKANERIIVLTKWGKDDSAIEL